MLLTQFLTFFVTLRDSNGMHFSIHQLQKNMIQPQITIFTRNSYTLCYLLSLVDIFGARTQVKYCTLQTQVCCGQLSGVGQLSAVLRYYVLVDTFRE